MARGVAVRQEPMREELFDLIMVPLLTFFFAALQRRRTHRRYRLWLGGWLLVLASMAIWEWERIVQAAPAPAETLRTWSIMLAGIAFLISFGQKELELRQLRNFALMLCVPACSGVLLINLKLARPWLITVLIIAGQMLALLAMRRYFGLRSAARKLMLDFLAIASGTAMLLLVLHHSMEQIYIVVLAEIFTAAGMMFLTLPMHGRAGQWIVAQGFFFWAAEYPLYAWAGSRPGWVHTVATLNNLWYLPKYLAAFGMILRVMEEDQAQVRILTEEYRLLYEGNPHPMLVFSPESGRILSANHAAQTTYGYSPDELLAMEIGSIFLPEEATKGAKMMRSERRLDHYQTRSRRKDGTTFYAEMTMYPVTFQSCWARFLLVVDITANVELNRELLRMAHHDPLTGLPNRALLEDRMKQWIAMMRRSEKPAALMTIDLDRFKQVNDTYGHLVGDECLKQVASRLQSRIRQSDTLARTGGEEFTLVVGQVSSAEGARVLAEKLLRLFEEPLVTSAGIIPISISIGVALYPEDATDLNLLRKLSDDALYQAKRSGRNRVVFASEVDALSARKPTSS